MIKEEFACNEVCIFNIMRSLGISIDENTKSWHGDYNNWSS